MKKSILLPFLFLPAILVGVAPVAFAQNGNTGVGNTGAPSKTPAYQAAYVPCGTDDVKNNKTGAAGPDNIVDNPCGFSDVIELARRLITGWIMAGVTIAALGFAYAGFLYITAMGSQEKISHAHSIFVKTFFGFVFMLSAWLIAKVLENEFLTPAFQQNSLLQDSKTN